MDVNNAVIMNITFLSPVNPTDMQRQSLPFSYLDVVVSSADGASHDVQLYTDITAGMSRHWNDCEICMLTVSLLRVGIW